MENSCRCKKNGGGGEAWFSIQSTSQNRETYFVQKTKSGKMKAFQRGTVINILKGFSHKIMIPQ